MKKQCIQTVRTIAIKMTVNICIMIERSQRAFTFITSFECQNKEMSRADVRLLFLTTRNLQQVAIMGDNTMEEWSTANLNFNPRFETRVFSTDTT